MRIHTCMSACVHTHTHTHTSFHSVHSLYQGNQKSKLLGPLCPFPSPLGPENIISNRPPRIRGSQAKKSVKKSSWKGLQRARSRHAQGPRQTAWENRSPILLGSPPAPSRMAPGCQSWDRHRQSRTGNSWGWEPAESQAGMSEKPVQR